MNRNDRKIPMGKKDSKSNIGIMDPSVEEYLDQITPSVISDSDNKATSVPIVEEYLEQLSPAKNSDLSTSFDVSKAAEISEFTPANDPRPYSGGCEKLEMDSKEQLK